MVSKLLRLLPMFKGKARLARLVLKDRGVSNSPQLVKGRLGLKYYVPNTNESIGFFLLINGIYEQPVSSYIAARLPESGVFIDIGINIGTISLPVARQRQDVSIIGIEASNHVFECLSKNIAVNGVGSIVAVNKAVSDSDGEFISFFSPEGEFGKGSMSPVFTKQENKVETVSLDSLIREMKLEQVDFIKVDVEGYEYNVFKGGKELLSGSGAPDIIFEFVDWAEDLANGIEIGDAQELLKTYGYTLYDFNDIAMGPIDVVRKGNRDILASKRPIQALTNIKS